LFIAARQTGFHEQSNQLKKNSIAIITAAVLEMSIPHSGNFGSPKWGAAASFRKVDFGSSVRHVPWKQKNFNCIQRKSILASIYLIN
jgi:hypothetical protein